MNPWDLQAQPTWPPETEMSLISSRQAFKGHFSNWGPQSDLLTSPRRCCSEDHFGAVRVWFTYRPHGPAWGQAPVVSRAANSRRYTVSSKHKATPVNNLLGAQACSPHIADNPEKACLCKAFSYYLKKGYASFLRISSHPKEWRSCTPVHPRQSHVLSGFQEAVGKWVSR